MSTQTRLRHYLPGDTSDMSGLARARMRLETMAAETYRSRVLSTGPIAYWILGEAAGLVATEEVNSPAQDGTYGAAVTLGHAGIGDGNTSAFFSGALNAHTDVFSVALSGVWSGAVGSMALWSRIPAAAWIDGAQRFSLTVTAGAGNNMTLGKHTVNNTLRWRASRGGVFGSQVLNTGGELNFFHMAMTWEEPANQIHCYYNGALIAGGTVGGFGAWVGALAAAYIGDNTTRFHGYLAHAAMWNYMLTPAQIATLATIP